MATPRKCLLRACLPLLLTLSCIGAQAVVCDFENEIAPLCGFSNVATDDADFTRSTGSGPSRPGPGATDFLPGSDHTYRNATGHFLNAHVGNARGQFSVARARSPAVATPTGTAKVCLQFAFRLMGQSVDSLLVYRAIGARLQPVFNATGSLGPDWRVTTMDVEVPTGTGSLQFMFAAIIVMAGDIAIDDFKVSQGECTVEAFAVTTVPTTVPASTTTVMPALASYDCTFDDPGDDECAPRMDAGNDFDWMFRRAGIRPNNQAPVYDHTTSTSAGLYLYVPQDGGQTSAEETSSFSTATLQIAFQPKCLEFYYYMRGSQVGTLSLYTGRSGSAAPPPLMGWNRTGDQGGYWTRGLMDVHPIFSDYQIVFEVKRLRDYLGCIAVDDLRLMDGRCPSEEVICDFESLHVCYFTQDRTTDDMDWVLGNGETPSFGTGPPNDHTYGNSSGFYMFIETSSPSAVGHVARLISPPITETHGHAHCLIFWYHMYGEHVDTLNVHMANATTPTLRKRLWSLSGNRGNKWRAAEVHVSSPLDFVIIFEATRGSSYQGDISIDDVWITSTEGCPGEAGLKNISSITCDFEEVEICYWAQDSSDDFDWTWENVAYSNRGNTGPSGDHTSGSQLGFYMFIMENYQTFPGGAARLMSPTASPQTAKSCLEFYYHMYGRDIETLSVYMKKPDDSELGDPIWSMMGNKGNNWHRATVDIPITDYTFQFVMEGTRGESYRDNIAIDDVKFYEGQDCPIVTTQAPSPTTVPNPVVSADCDFEDDDNPMCGYQQSIHDDLDWSRDRSDPAESVIMIKTAKGGFLYLDFRANYPKDDDRAELYSPLMAKSNQPRCLEFSYFVSGSNADFLMIYLTQWGSTLAIDPFFSLYGEQGQQWNVAHVDIPPMDTNFQVVFVGALTYYTYVGIDDIKFTTGACPSMMTTPLPTDGHCDFERGYKACGYEHERYDFVWRAHRGHTASVGTGPSVDHTTGTANGQFMYVEASLPQRPNQRARLMTPPLFHTMGTPFCMLFYYHMNGKDVGQINVYVKADAGTTRLLKLTGNSRDVWQPAAVDLSDAGSRFQVIFEGVVGYGVAGDMALDDVSIRREPCPGFAKTASLNFEMPGDLNGFRQLFMGGTNWVWYDQYTEVQSTLPEELLAGDGSFIYINGTKSKPETSASLLSPIMAGHSTEHCLDYDYALYGDSELRLSIGQKGGLSYDLEFWAGATAWRHQRRTLTKAEVGEDFAIVFTGVVGSQGNGYVALDNLVIRDNSCGELPKPGDPVAQVSTGSATAAIVLFVILLLFVVAITAVGGACFLRHRQGAKSIPPVLYSNKADHGEANDNNTEGALSKDLSIANPNYDHAALHSSA